MTWAFACSASVFFTIKSGSSFDILNFLILTFRHSPSPGTPCGNLLKVLFYRLTQLPTSHCSRSSCVLIMIDSKFRRVKSVMPHKSEDAGFPKVLQRIAVDALSSIRRGSVRCGENQGRFAGNFALDAVFAELNRWSLGGKHDRPSP